MLGTALCWRFHSEEPKSLSSDDAVVGGQAMNLETRGQAHQVGGIPRRTTSRKRDQGYDWERRGLTEEVTQEHTQVREGAKGAGRAESRRVRAVSGVSGRTSALI